jgi:hypothetical protein
MNNDKKDNDAVMHATTRGAKHTTELNSMILKNKHYTTDVCLKDKTIDSLAAHYYKVQVNGRTYNRGYARHRRMDMDRHDNESSSSD